MHSDLIIGQIRQHGGTDPTVFYTDGSVSRRRVGNNVGWMTGWGYLTTDGRYGCGKTPQFGGKGGTDGSISVTTELRAIWHANGRLTADGVPTIVRTDSQEAITMIDRWKAGSDVMPRGYVGSGKRPSTLHQLRQAVTDHPECLSIEHVKGHGGDVLNEAADTLALLGVRWARDNLTTDDVTTRARGIAEGFLADYHRQRR